MKINLEDYRGAIVVLENYLDGAVSDYEYNTVDNDSLIWESSGRCYIERYTIFTVDGRLYLNHYEVDSSD